MFHHFQQPKQQGSSIEQLAPSPFPSDLLPFRHKAWFSHCRSRPPIRISPYAWGRQLLKWKPFQPSEDSTRIGDP
ncbi:hypothetical protein QYF36_006065 [Acer negundo]|nr:hypothetical protein QYF36_006065 [Acer negundo]